MIKLIEIENKTEWDKFVEQINSADTYYTWDYLRPFVEIEKGKICLLTYSNKDFKLCYPILIKDIADDNKFKDLIPKATYYDIETPYGYGGPIVNNVNNLEMEMFAKELFNWANENKVISHFFRFHPLLENHKICSSFVELDSFKQTVYMDLKDEDTIYKNLNDKCRNMLKKATKNNIRVEINNSSEAQQLFIRLYQKTMKRNNAADYYYFNDRFFNELFKRLGKFSNIFNAIYEEKIISSAIVLEKNTYLHYHLSAADRDYMKLAGNNMLLYEVAKYGLTKGYKKFHLGGGVEAEDGLFLFKKSFNKKGVNDFFIGRIIFSKDKYNELMELRELFDKSFNVNNSRMIGYRA